MYILMYSGLTRPIYIYTISGSMQVMSFGWNEHGMCGTGHERNVHAPSPVVSGLAEWEPVLVGAGAGHSFVLAHHI